MDVFVSRTINQKTYMKKFRGGLQPPHSPLDPPITPLFGKYENETGCKRKETN